MAGRAIINPLTSIKPAHHTLPENLPLLGRHHLDMLATLVINNSTKSLRGMSFLGQRIPAQDSIRRRLLIMTLVHRHSPVVLAGATRISMMLDGRFRVLGIRSKDWRPLDRRREGAAWQAMSILC